MNVQSYDIPDIKYLQLGPKVTYCMLHSPLRITAEMLQHAPCLFSPNPALPDLSKHWASFGRPLRSTCSSPPSHRFLTYLWKISNAQDIDAKLFSLDLVFLHFLPLWKSVFAQRMEACARTRDPSHSFRLCFVPAWSVPRAPSAYFQQVFLNSQSSSAVARDA